jgi:hypothetical protein
MAHVKVLAGDFRKGAGGYSFGCLSATPEGTWSPKAYSLKTNVSELELADERSTTKVFGAAGWGTVGAVLAGPLGLAAGAILGGRGQKVVFVAKFDDGKRLMGECDKATWTKMLAERF